MQETITLSILICVYGYGFVCMCVYVFLSSVWYILNSNYTFIAFCAFPP